MLLVFWLYKENFNLYIMLGQKEGADTDQTFDIKAQIKRIVIGLIFITAMPLLLSSAANVDLIQGCVIWASQDEITKYDEVITTRNNVDNDVTNDITFNAAETKPGDCKNTLSAAGDSKFLTNALADTQLYIVTGISIVILIMGLAILIGPGIKIVRYELD